MFRFKILLKLISYLILCLTFSHGQKCEPSEKKYVDHDSVVSIDLPLIQELYAEYYVTLRYIRERMEHRVLGDKDFQPQFDDTEAEVLALLIAWTKPSTIFEFSPCAGYSTGILLDSLSLINNGKGVVKSFDIHNTSMENLGAHPVHNVKWEFSLGDVREQFSQWDYNAMDFLFIDSDHSKGFTENYLKNLLIPLLKFVRDNYRRCLVSVHDVFHCIKGGGSEYACPSDEGVLVLDFLKKEGIPYFTPAWNQGHYPGLLKIKRELGFDKIISKSWGINALEYQTNSAIFFILQ